MITHELIEPFSNEWWSFNIITIISIIFLILWAKSLKQKNINILSNSLAILFISKFILIHTYKISNNMWYIQDSLPLHLCSLMWFVTIYLLLTKKQWAFEMMLFIGMPGGVHSLLTPELTNGSDLINKIDFFVGHGGLVLAPFYCLFVLGMKPRHNGWYMSFLKIQILAMLVFIINLLTDANYMYLISPPIANNPLVPSSEKMFGQWPYYIFIFEVFILIHAFIINVPFLIKETNKMLKYE